MDRESAHQQGTDPRLPAEEGNEDSLFAASPVPQSASTEVASKAAGGSPRGSKPVEQSEASSLSSDKRQGLSPTQTHTEPPQGQQPESASAAEGSTHAFTQGQLPDSTNAVEGLTHLPTQAQLPETANAVEGPTHVTTQAQGAAPTQNQLASTGKPDEDANSAPPKHYIATWLKKRTLIPMIIVTASMIGAIIALCVVSAVKRGLARVDDRSITLANFQVGLGLTWTSLPSFSFTIYGLLIRAIMKAIETRQPFVELWDHGLGAPAGKSVLLDYNAYPPYEAWAKAIKNKHHLVAAGIKIAATTHLVGALAAHLFTPVLVSGGSPQTVQQESSFNSSAFFASSDIAPVLDTVASTQIYGGELPPWTTSTYSLLNFTKPEVSSGTIGLSNFSISTTAYSADIDCVALPSSQFGLTRQGQSWSFEGLDRGCFVQEPDIFAGPVVTDQNVTFEYYLQTFANVSCPIDAGWTRLVAVAAANFNDNSNVLTNITAVSCRTSYYSSLGILNVTLDHPQSAAPRIQSFMPQNKTLIDPRPTFAVSFEQVIHQPSVVDDTVTLAATEFGRLIFSYAQKQSPQGFLNESILANAISNIFPATFSVMSTTYLVQESNPISIQGTLYVSSTKLIVVQQVAYAIISVLAVVVVMLSLTYFVIHVQKQESILYEEPIGLWGSAAILRHSELQKEAERLGAENGKAVDMRKAFEPPSELGQKGWKMVDWENPSQARIVTTEESRQGPLHFSLRRKRKDNKRGKSQEEKSTGERESEASV